MCNRPQTQAETEYQDTVRTIQAGVLLTAEELVDYIVTLPRRSDALRAARRAICWGLETGSVVPDVVQERLRRKRLAKAEEMARV